MRTLRQDEEHSKAFGALAGKGKVEEVPNVWKFESVNMPSHICTPVQTLRHHIPYPIFPKRLGDKCHPYQHGSSPLHHNRKRPKGVHHLTVGQSLLIAILVPPNRTQAHPLRHPRPPRIRLPTLHPPPIKPLIMMQLRVHPRTHRRAAQARVLLIPRGSGITRASRGAIIADLIDILAIIP